MKRRSPTRPGYTLLEILLASVIAMLLLTALYAALDVTLLRMEVNRDLIARNDLRRAVINRMSADLVNTLGPLPPKSGGDGMTGTGSSASTGTVAASTATAATATTTAAASGSTTDATTTDSPVVTGADIPLGSGVVGTDKQLTIFLSRVPTSLVDLEAAANVDVSLPADLRRVTYYLSSDGVGLCRQERPWVTADGVWNTSDPDRTDELSEIIAPEVLDVTFEYFDGSAWQSTWDGSQTASDGVALTGPPRAIRVTFVMQFSSRGAMLQKQVVHTFPVRTAVGNYVPPTTDSTTTTTGGM